jgi:hypothetical protein
MNPALQAPSAPNQAFAWRVCAFIERMSLLRVRSVRRASARLKRRIHSVHGDACLLGSVTVILRKRDGIRFPQKRAWRTSSGVSSLFLWNSTLSRRIFSSTDFTDLHRFFGQFSAEIRVNPRLIHAPQRNTLPVSTKSACESYQQNL